MMALHARAVERIGLGCILSLLTPQPATAQRIEPVWERWGAVPVLSESRLALGRSGICAGIVGDELAAAGGSNFPEPGKTVTRGGSKRLYRDAAAFGFTSGQWRSVAALLPVPLEQALSVPVAGGFLCIGGTSDGAEPQRSVIRISRNGRGELTADSLPSLPFPIEAPVGARIGTVVLVASGDRLLSLDLGAPDGWHERAPLPWRARTDFAAASARGLLFAIGGRYRQDGQWQASREVLAYDPRHDRWTRRADMPAALSSATLVQLAGSLFVFGGVERETYAPIDAVRAARDAAGSEERARLEAELTQLYDHDGGFSPAVYRYDIARDRWYPAGWHPGPAAIKRPAVPFGTSVLLVGGEINPGKRTPVIWRVSADRRQISGE